MRWVLMFVLIVATILAYGIRSAPPAPPKTVIQFHMCQEGEACYNWTTMGDYQRGINVDGAVLIVDARSFCRIPARIRLAQTLPFDPHC